MHKSVRRTRTSSTEPKVLIGPKKFIVSRVRAERPIDNIGSSVCRSGPRWLAVFPLIAEVNVHPDSRATRKKSERHEAELFDWMSYAQSRRSWMVCLGGTFDEPQSAELFTELERLLEEATVRSIVIDLTALRHISYACLAEIGTYARRVRASGRLLVLANPPFELCDPSASSKLDHPGLAALPIGARDEQFLPRIDREFATSILDSLFDVGLGLTVAGSLLREVFNSSLDDSSTRYLVTAIDEIDQLISSVREEMVRSNRAILRPPRHLRAEVDGFEIGRPTVRLFGELDTAAHDYVLALLVTQSGGQVFADLSGLTFIDARGVSTLLCARQDLANLDRELLLGGATGAVLRVVELLGLQQTFRVQQHSI